MKCVFVPEWECNIETEEIPLEVCKVCIEARKTSVFIKRRKEASE
jgi:hypothetical protein